MPVFNKKSRPDRCDRIRFIDSVKDTICIEPSNISPFVVSDIVIGHPNCGATPLDVNFLSIFIGSGELFLLSEPELVVWEELEPSSDVIEDGIFAIDIELLQVEEASEV